MTTRVGLATYVHGNLPALTATLRACGDTGVGHIIFFSDEDDIGLHPKVVLELLVSREHLLYIRGNPRQLDDAQLPSFEMG